MSNRNRTGSWGHMMELSVVVEMFYIYTNLYKLLDACYNGTFKMWLEDRELNSEFHLIFI